ncbi:fimbrial protein [Citrobacter sp. Cb003]|uniref:fimbrial protein n=1 Tax=Citrobacter sp. Cb003 TaxID=2985005 RepID=UPI00257AC23B|nr:fimbrial protein [Citrobacter sp. Cb003]MDM3379285.1 fimbrial protein [Citrobacter sp. Cb003]
MIRQFIFPALIIFSIMGRVFAAAEGDYTHININGSLIGGADCTINNGKPIQVIFAGGNNIITRNVDGVNYRTKIVYSMTCNNLSKNSLKLSLSGDAASFDSTLFQTSKPDLGIKLEHGTNKVSRGAAINFTWPTLPELYVTPVAENNLTLTAGIFTGTAVMKIDYQ